MIIGSSFQIACLNLIKQIIQRNLPLVSSRRRFLFGMADRLYRLRHDTVVCCYYKNCDICGVCATHTHSCKRFMSRCIEEGDLLSVDLYNRSTDMLCDSTSLCLSLRGYHGLHPEEMSYRGQHDPTQTTGGLETISFSSSCLL